MPTRDELIGRMGASGDLGQQLDKRLEDAKKRAAQLQGGAAHIKEASKRAAASVAAWAQKQAEDGELEGLTGGQLEQKLNDAARIYTMCLINYCEKIATDALAADGKVSGLIEAVDEAQKWHNNARIQYDRMLAGPQPVPEGGEAEDGRPERAQKMSADERMARDKAAASGEIVGIDPGSPLAHECPRCDAKVGAPCTTASGNQTDPHAPRRNLVTEASKEEQADVSG